MRIHKKGISFEEWLAVPERRSVSSQPTGVGPIEYVKMSAKELISWNNYLVNQYRIREMFIISNFISVKARAIKIK